jgi:hypothetical protein
MSPEFRVLIVGGYGTFGERLVELLEDYSQRTLLVAGRSLSLAREYCSDGQAPPRSSYRHCSNARAALQAERKREQTRRAA